MNSDDLPPLAPIRAATRADIPSIAAVHVASWHASYPGIMDQRLIDERTVEMRTAQWSAILDEPQRETLVATGAAGEILGFVSAVVLSEPVEGCEGYLQLLYLAPAAKRRGIGTALLRAVAAKLVARGCRSMALRVVRRNPARAFYERLGARLHRPGIPLDAGMFDDVVYAFDDLRMLLAPLEAPNLTPPHPP